MVNGDRLIRRADITNPAVLGVEDGDLFSLGKRQVAPPTEGPG